ncbi:MAG: DUF507 family protein [Deltaproteobacteria bacterium]|nr:DUF507 family protein [Deltaproteobacteria bacterium]
MRLYRRLVPKISKDIVRGLLAESLIDIEDGHRDEAELDVAGVLVDYLNVEEKLVNDARDEMDRRKLPQEKYGLVKRALAEQRKIKIGDETLDFILDKVVESLFNSKHISEVFAEDHDIRRKTRDVLGKYSGVDEELDREARGRLRNLREGTPEWDIEYQKTIKQLRTLKGFER